MFGWLPIIGPIIDGITTIFVKTKNVELEKYKTDAHSAVEIARLNNELTVAFKDQVGVRLARDIIILPVAVWTALISWDTIVVLNHPQWMVHIEKFPDTLSYLPYAVLTFLLGQAWINKK